MTSPTKRHRALYANLNATDMIGQSSVPNSTDSTSQMLVGRRADQLVAYSYTHPQQSLPSTGVHPVGSLSCISDDSGISLVVPPSGIALLSQEQVDRCLTICDTPADCSVSNRSTTECLLNYASTRQAAPNQEVLMERSATDLTSSELVLPAGWRQCQDDSGEPYFWHVPTGRTQREPPSRKQARCIQSRPASQVATKPRNSQTLDTNAHGANRPVSSNELISGSCLNSTNQSDCEPKQPSSDTFEVVPIGSRVLDEQKLSDSYGLRSWLLETVTCFERFPGTLQDAASNNSSNSKCIDNALCNTRYFLELNSTTVLLRNANGDRTLHSRPLRFIRLWATLDNFVVYIALERGSSESGYEHLKQMHVCYIVRATTHGDALHIAEAFRKRSQLLAASGKLRIPCTVEKLQSETITPAKPIVTLRSHSESASDPEQIERLVEAHIAELEADEPIRVIPCYYIGCCSTSRATGVDTLNEAVTRVCDATSFEQYVAAYLLVTPSEFRLRRAVGSLLTSSQQGDLAGSVLPSQFLIDPHSIDSLSEGELIVRCPLRFLSFFAVAADNVHLCGLMLRHPDGAPLLRSLSNTVHSSSNVTTEATALQNASFECHVVYCEPDAGRLCQLLQAACTLRFQKALDSACARRRATTDVMNESNASLRFGENAHAKLASADVSSQSSLQTLVTSFSLFKRFSNKPEHR